jgi:acyl carrier protein
MNSVAEWDSLTALNLIALLEEEFGLQVAPDDVDQLVSFQLIHQFLMSKNSAIRS